MMSEQELLDIIEDYRACERGDFNLHSLAFGVAAKMVRGNDLRGWERLPEPLQSAVLNIARAYLRDGTVVSLSSTGRATHDELGKSLCALLGDLLAPDRMRGE